MAPLQIIPSLDQMEDISVQVSYLWSPGGCHISTRAPGLILTIVHVIIWIVAAFWPTGVYSSPTQIMAPLQVIPVLSNGRYTFSGLPLMISSWVQYLAKGPGPDFNKGPEDNSNSGHILAPAIIWVQFE